MECPGFQPEEAGGRHPVCTRRRSPRYWLRLHIFLFLVSTKLEAWTKLGNLAVTFLFLLTPRCVWDLSSLTRYGTLVPCNDRPQPLDHQASPKNLAIIDQALTFGSNRCRGCGSEFCSCIWSGYHPSTCIFSLRTVNSLYEMPHWITIKGRPASLGPIQGDRIRIKSPSISTFQEV